MTRTKLGQLLVQEGVLEPADVTRALQLQHQLGGHLGTNLLELGIAKEEHVLPALGRQLATATVSAHELARVANDVIEMVPAKLALRHNVVPFQLQGRTISLASLEPGNLLVEDEIGVLSSCMARTYVGLELWIYDALHRYYGAFLGDRYAVLARRLRESDGPPGNGHGRRSAGPPPVPADQVAEPPAPSVVPTPRAYPRRAPDIMDLPEDLEYQLRTIDTVLQPSVEPPSVPEPVLSPAPEVAPAVVDLDPGSALERASRLLAGAEIRDEIADAVLGFCETQFERGLLMLHRRDEILGWRGFGHSIRREAVLELCISAAEPSLFSSLARGAPFFRGPLPALATSRQLVAALGQPMAAECLVLPVRVRGTVVGYLYLDNLTRTLAEAPVAETQRLAEGAGVAFEIYVLRGKLRRHLASGLESDNA